MKLDPDPRYHEALMPLAEFCAEHGYRWRWKISRPDQWHATVQILDPALTARSDKVRAWYGSTNVDEMTALRNAVQYAIDGARRKIQPVSKHPPGPPSLKGAKPVFLT